VRALQGEDAEVVAPFTLIVLDTRSVGELSTSALVGNCATSELSIPIVAARACPRQRMASCESEVAWIACRKL